MRSEWVMVLLLAVAEPVLGQAPRTAMQDRTDAYVRPAMRAPALAASDPVHDFVRAALADSVAPSR
jgi:hypothetical protein